MNTLLSLVLSLVVTLSLWAGVAQAQNDAGLAGSVVLREGVGTSGTVQVLLPKAVPYRVFTLDDPRRLVLDFQGISEFEVPDRGTAAISSMRAGKFRAGWARIVADLKKPLAVASVELKHNNNNTAYIVEIVLKQVSVSEYARRSVPSPDEAAPQRIERAAALDTGRRTGAGTILVALDPGHGGIDPGANRDGLVEKDITLEFGRELRRQLQASGRFSVFMTRTGDEFVSLRERVMRARAAQASLLISLHVNTVTKGRASGAAVYVLGEAGDDSEADAMAAFENNSDAMSGLAPEGTETDILRLLNDMARVETSARSAQLAKNLLAGLRDSVGVIRSRPSRAAEFRVLQAPDVPSVLLELGFLSDTGDREDLMSPQWRTKAARGIVAALDAWVAADAEAARLARQ